MNGLKAIIIIISLPVLLLIMIYYFDLAYLKSEVPVTGLISLNLWIHENIEYKSDFIIQGDIAIPRDNWQYPRETLLLKTGDCDDLAILYIYLAKKLFHWNCKGVWLVSNNSQGHFIVLSQDVAIDPTMNVIEYFPIYQYRYNYVVKKVYTWKELLREIPERRDLIFKY